jgi:hypothetical protein
LEELTIGTDYSYEGDDEWQALADTRFPALKTLAIAKVAIDPHAIATSRITSACRTIRFVGNGAVHPALAASRGLFHQHVEIWSLYDEEQAAELQAAGFAVIPHR